MTTAPHAVVDPSNKLAAAAAANNIVIETEITKTLEICVSKAKSSIRKIYRLNSTWL